MVYTDEKKKILGKNIWLRRECSNMTRNELASKLGVRHESVINWENGKCPPTKDSLFKLTKIFKCSKNDLHRQSNIPVLKLIDDPKVGGQTKNTPIEYEFKIVDNKPIVSIKSEEPETKSEELIVESVEEVKEVHPVTARLREYLRDNNMSAHRFSRESGISSGSVWRVENGLLKNFDNPIYEKVDAYLDKVSCVKEVNEVDNEVETNPDSVSVECKEEQPVQPSTLIEKEKASLSDRLNTIYNTLFNSLAELDELAQDIAKIEKVTAMLKEIQGL